MNKTVDYETSDVSGEHVVWECSFSDGSHVTTYTDKPEVAERIEKLGAVVFPVFRFPAITPQEQKAIAALRDRLRVNDAIDVELDAILRGLLERLDNKKLA